MKRYNSVGGFAYMEVLLLTMVVSTAAMLVMSGFREAQRVNRTAAIRTAAVFLADAKIAEIQNLADAKIAEIQNDPSAATGSIETFEDFMGGMTVVFVIEPECKSVDENRWTVTVTPTVDGKLQNDLIVTVERVIINRP